MDAICLDIIIMHQQTFQTVYFLEQTNQARCWEKAYNINYFKRKKEKKRKCLPIKSTTI